MASMNSLRTAFSHSLKGKSRLDGVLAGVAAPRYLSTSGAFAAPSAGPSSQTAIASSSTSTGPSLSSGPLPSEPISATAEALELLRTQPNHYVVASITGRTFLLAASDLVTVPRLKDVEVGDVLELDRIHEVGSRDYTLRAQDPMHCRSRGPSALMRRSVLTGPNSYISSSSSHATQPTSSATAAAPPPAAAGAAAGTTQSSIADQVRAVSSSWATRLHPAGLAHIGATLDPTAVRVRAVVVEHTKGAMERILKKKRRKGYKKTIEHKQPYTRIRIERIEIAPRNAS
ncbi:uncharacterized protein PFL1_05405 [Pseudozyma flocculosa PF-1]|uniref:Large ribosomal subunit protein bL21m n=2 Tax=Pseudozyma flocculosa TaxID=84751 RepID=A0A5C3FA53_9BASI|nr:uncharacterized protein PFL1_05405 [Pseudozyma flocculosa PF-1]EPQ27124.1 hypothetical protein PFL1_05405 [Pseudozyma flocculosa PF-1]SPO41304.1 related to MRPL49 - mitochondrial ribosomal protein of the large subunit [Pseudozyma flocculosa]